MKIMLSQVFSLYIYMTVTVSQLDTQTLINAEYLKVWNDNIKHLRIIIIIIKKDSQCKAERGRLTPYQSEDPSPKLPTYRGKEEKGKIVEDKKWEQLNKKALDLLVKPANPTPSNTGSTKSFQRDTERGIKVLRYCEVLQRGGDERSKHRV